MCIEEITPVDQVVVNDLDVDAIGELAEVVVSLFHVGRFEFRTTLGLIIVHFK